MSVPSGWSGQRAHLRYMDTRSTSTSDPVPGLPALMDVAELAAYLGMPISTVYDWRTRGKGPRPTG